LGTDNGAYVSFNRGESWEVFSKELPNVAVHDLVIQPEAKHLVLGTHGRSIYIADISLLQKLNETNRNEVVLAEIDSLNFSPRWGRKFSTWGEVFEPKVKIQFYSPQAGKATISIKTEDGKELKSLFIETVKGVNIIEYDLSISEKGMKVLEKENVKIKKAENGKYYLPKGQYKLGMNLSTKYSTIVFSIK
jgi:hypothetical protein